MIHKYFFIQSFIALLYLNNVLGQKPEQDDLDRSTLAQSGCQFLSLGNGDSATYSLNTTTLTHATLASLTSDVSPDKFELHFAVRAASDVEITLFSRARFNKTTLTPDFKFEIGLNGGDFTHATAAKSYYYEDRDLTEVNHRYTPGLLSADKYVKLYIKIDKRWLRFGEECEPFPFMTYFNYGTFNQDIALMRIATTAPGGARLLLDCPPTFGGCKCT